MTPSILNIATYRFVALQDLSALRDSLRSSAQTYGLKGTILLAPEGINIFMAGEKDAAESFMQMLDSDARFTDLVYKKSYSNTIPFKRLLVKIKKEIITLRTPTINPLLQTAPSVEPEALKAWLDAGKPVVLLDTRNDFEVQNGTFIGAINPQINAFSELPDKLASLDHYKDMPIVTFCTGGIRCEKAAPLLLQAGFREVYQLSGGILNYFEKCGDAHYQGECFVFDERRAVHADLSPAVDTPPILSA